MVVAAREERFTRKKHDPSFPVHAIACCLETCKVELSDLTYILFYDKPMLKFERLLETPFLVFTERGAPAAVEVT